MGKKKDNTTIIDTGLYPISKDGLADAYLRDLIVRHDTSSYSNGSFIYPIDKTHDKKIIDNLNILYITPYKKENSFIIYNDKIIPKIDTKDNYNNSIK